MQILANSLALELVLVSMNFALPEPGAPLVIYPVVVMVSRSPPRARAVHTLLFPLLSIVRQHIRLVMRDARP